MQVAAEKEGSLKMVTPYLEGSSPGSPRTGTY